MGMMKIKEVCSRIDTKSQTEGQKIYIHLTDTNTHTSTNVGHKKRLMLKINMLTYISCQM